MLNGVLVLGHILCKDDESNGDGVALTAKLHVTSPLVKQNKKITNKCLPQLLGCSCQRQQSARNLQRDLGFVSMQKSC
jgi:hypothetical protein